MKCAHCQIDYPENSLFIQNDKAFCCKGCASVYEIIHTNNLDEFYHKASSLKKIDSQKPTYTPEPEILDDGSYKISFLISNAHCAACAWLCSKMLYKNKGILKLDINPATYAAKIIYNPSLTNAAQITNLIASLGYVCAPIFSQSNEKGFIKQYYSRLIVAIACLCNVMWLSVAKYAGLLSQISQKALDILNFAEFILCLPVLFYCAFSLFISAKNGLKARILNMDFLIVLASLLAFIYSVYAMLHHLEGTYFDSIVMLLCFIYFARFAQAKISNKALRQVRLLSSWLAGDIRVLNEDLSESKLSAIMAKKDDVILIKQGERILIDGEFIQGEALLDESFLTGEAQLRAASGLIYSGAVCVNGSFTYKATKSLSASRLACIDEALNHTQKSRTQDICERLGHFFSILVIFLCALCWFMYQDISRCVAVLIIACPCALSLSAPLASLLANSAALKLGIILKISDFMQIDIKKIAFDKTGTLSALKVNNDFSCFKYQNELFTIAKLNPHPIAQAILEALPNAKLLDAAFSMQAGYGAFLEYEGSKYFLGKEGFKTVFKKDNELICEIYLSNSANSCALACINELKKLNYELAIISGDNEANTKALASELAINTYYAACKPEDKINFIDAKTLFIGDGHNDALALKKAGFSLAIANGSEIARVHADGVLENIANLPKLLALISRTKKIIISNLIISLIYNLAFIPLAFLGVFNPLIAAALMSASSICVVANSLRIK